MLSYQHSYHAGNFADVIKHMTLTRIIQHVCYKDKPVLFVDSHAGRGVYDLESKEATKNQEFLQGITLLWGQRENSPAIFAPFFNVIKDLNYDGKLRYYPGSPLLALSGLRAQDRMVFNELHPYEFSCLSHLSTQRKRVFFKNADGLKELAALLPPIERRAIVFIDPAYEIKNEYKNIPDIIKLAHSRFATGIYCLWYPIINEYNHTQILNGLSGINTKKILRLEFFLTTKTQQGLSGCGLYIINPPYTIQQEMQTMLTYLCTVFNPGASSYLLRS